LPRNPGEELDVALREILDWASDQCGAGSGRRPVAE
jgi:hypothetical protein